MASDGVVLFDMFEHQKENIAPLVEGRSAAALAKAFSYASLASDGRGSTFALEREEFERRINESEDLDDPLEVWIEYITWTHEKFPQGASAESGLVELLERCTTQFASTGYYANDPRYLRIWLEYARYNDNPREVFSFLFQKGIGAQLATFYEEYAKYLELLGRKHQAQEVYVLGIENQARPVDRLRRRYEQFVERVEYNPPDPNEPRSPAMQVARPALATKELTILDRDANLLQAAGTSTHERPRQREKMAIFVDPDDSASGKVEQGAGGWETIGSIAERRKENTIASRPLAGEIMHMQRPQQQHAVSAKLSIFRDSSAAAAPDGATLRPAPTPAVTGQKPKRAERFVVNLDAIYLDGHDEEMSFEELRWHARQRQLQREQERAREHQRAQQQMLQARAMEAQRQTPMKNVTQSMPLKDSPEIRRRPASPTMTVHTRAATDEIYDLFNQPLKCDIDAVEPQGVADSDEDEDDDDDDDDDAEEDSDEDEDEEEEEEDEEDEDDVTQPPAMCDKDSTSENQHYEQHANDENIPQQQPPLLPATPQQERIPVPGKDRFKIAMMTPIVETTESIATITRTAVHRNNRFLEHLDEEGASSSPFTEHPPERHAPVPYFPKFAVTSTTNVWDNAPIVKDMLVNPMEESIRATILENAHPGISSFAGYLNHKGKTLGKCDVLAKVSKASKRSSGTLAADTDVVLGHSTYHFRRVLGEGAFAPVYLFESASTDDKDAENIIPDGSRLCAIKMEQPSNAWEFYALRETERRLTTTACAPNLAQDVRMRALDSIIRAQELHTYGDASCLVMEYNDQGTILDIVNLFKADSVKTASSPVLGLDEGLAMFFTVELLRTVEALHGVGILHGDLKPDNCMVRLVTKSGKSTAALSLPDSGKLSSAYIRTGENGWRTKGISLIDFGRAIDLTSYPRGVQFMADWKTCEQDCAEMRELRPWSYQVDYHGLASIVHMLLFGKHIETMADASAASGRRKRYRVAQGFKRYWQQDMWKELFDLLLNSAAVRVEQARDENAEDAFGGAGDVDKAFPVTQRLRQARARMEAYLEENSERGGGTSLRISLQRMEALILAEKRKSGM
ncbi:Mad3/BUB1 homology region 1-domain-containing protein [Limtongia smithiae]|uniref:Mad3/BUB1 homology region 1-domain-containing protein n=1 Tax=Limtongia smithiae TaxID=1125753 RepID=UPI0034CFA497